MGAFLEATAVDVKGGRYTAVIDPEWFIWDPFGGYLAALALRAMGAASMHRRPATLSCQFLNVGVAGAIEIEITSLKSGRRTECLRAAITQAGEPLLEAQSWIVADELDGLEHEHARMPAIPAPGDLPILERWFDDEEEAQSPVWRYLERKPTESFGDQDHVPGNPEWACWLRLSEPLPANDGVLQAARAVLWMDLAPWNAVLAAHGWPMTHIAPTLDLTVQFQANLYAPETTASDWHLVTVESPTASNGLVGANARLWSEAGRLVAVGGAQGLCVPNPRYAGYTAHARNHG